MPVLTIIAGPNGAGESTHSKDILAHLSIEAFDFDKEFYSIWSRFRFDPHVEQGAFDRAQELYIQRRTAALRENQNFAFETNYHTRELFPILDIFRSQGYRLELVFICLENPENAIERVKDRVAKGGHWVDEETIRERFSNGLSLLDASFHLFDLVSIYLSKQNDMEGLLILEPSIKSVVSLSTIPKTLGTQLPLITQFVFRDTDRLTNGPKP